jgi:hypothetical protein
MATKKHIYGEINSKTGMQKVFSAIRKDVEHARSRPALTELYKRAGYLITLTHAPSWKEKFGREASELRKLGEKEFRSPPKRSIARQRKLALRLTSTRNGESDIWLRKQITDIAPLNPNIRVGRKKCMSPTI